MSTQASEAGPRVFGDDENEVEEEEEEYESDGSEPSAKRQKSSDIWEGFWILKQTGTSSKCSACKRILAKSGKSGPSLLRSLQSNVGTTGPDFDAARRAVKAGLELIADVIAKILGTNVLECHTKDDLFDDYAPPEHVSELE
nr:unnamed protein product [Digitaria exilis]